jgi:hypothetical protein
MSIFSTSVERWRTSCRKWAAVMASRFSVELDESWLLALIDHESGGDPTNHPPKSTAHRGLGQVGAGALHDYNAANSDAYVSWEWLLDADHGDDQVRVVAWLVASGRKIVRGWYLPDAKNNADLWADARYGWGAGNLRGAIDEYRDTHAGASPTFDQLAEFKPEAGKDPTTGEYAVRPWYHARTIAARAQKDRGAGGPALTPFPGAGAVVDVAAHCNRACCDRRAGGGNCPLEAR